MEIRNRNLLFYLVVAFWTFGCSSYSIRPDLSLSRYPLKRLAVVPFRTDVGTATLGVQEILPIEEEQLFRHFIYGGVAQALAKVKIESTLLMPEKIPGPLFSNVTSDILFELGLERQKAISDMALGFKRQFQYRCSDRIAELAKKVGVDGFVFLDFDGIRRSDLDYSLAFTRALLLTVLRGNIFTTFPGRSFVSGDLEIVDGPSGDLLYFNEVDTEEADFRDPEELVELMDDALDPFISEIGESEKKE